MAASAAGSRERIGLAGKHYCASCGAVARVNVLRGYEKGQPVSDFCCVNCVGQVELEQAVTPAVLQRLRFNELLGIVSILLCAFALAGDIWLPTAHPGFGMSQRLGIVLSSVLLLAGMLFGAELLAVLGGIGVAMALSVDWFGWTTGPGIHWKWQTAMFVGLFGLGCAAFRHWGPRWSSGRAAKPGKLGPKTNSAHSADSQFIELA